MKKITAILFVTLSVLLLFSLPVLAAEEEAQAPGFHDIGTAEDVVIDVFAGDTKVNANAENKYENSDRLEVEFTDATEGNYYGVLLVKGSSVPTKDTPIYYIDQVTAEAKSIDFNVYPILPAGPTELSLYISSNDPNFNLIQVPLAYYKYVPYVLGDVNDDGDITSNDALRTLKIVAKLVEPTNNESLAADVTKDGDITSNDALRILKYVAKLIDTL